MPYTGEVIRCLTYYVFCSLLLLVDLIEKIDEIRDLQSKFLKHMDKRTISNKKDQAYFKENYKLRYVYRFLSTGEKVYFYKKQIKNEF